MFFKVVVACGHVGRRREIEVTRYFEAKNALEVWDTTMHMHRAKKGQRSRCIRIVEEIDVIEYINGKIAEANNPYLQVRKNKANAKAG